MAYRDTKSFNYSSDEDTSESGDSDHDNESSWKRRKHVHSAPSPMIQEDLRKPPLQLGQSKTHHEGEKVKQKRVNKVWSTVLQGQEEKAVEFQMSNFDMDPFSSMADREVETYNYRNARDPEPPGNDERHQHENRHGHHRHDDYRHSKDYRNRDDHHRHRHDNHHHFEDDERESNRHVKRKRNMKERLGKRNVKDRLGNRDRNVKDRLGKKYYDIPIEVNELHDPETIAQEIIKRLDEQKDDLIRKIVEVLGNKKALQLLRETEEVERTGGMMTKNGSRRRHPGGVFLTIMKSDTDITKEQLDDINKFSQKMENQAKKKAEKRRRYLKAKRFKEQMKRQEEIKGGQDEEMESGEVESDEKKAKETGFINKFEVKKDDEMKNDEEKANQTGNQKGFVNDFEVKKEDGEIDDDSKEDELDHVGIKRENGEKISMES